MFGSGVGIYMMRKHMAPIEFFAEEAGLNRTGVVGFRVAVAATHHLASTTLDSVLPSLFKEKNSY
jgi:hypothetical protein